MSKYLNQYKVEMDKHTDAVEKGDYDEAERHARNAEEAAKLHHKTTGKKIRDAGYTGNSPHIMNEFKSVDGQSEVPDPGASGSAARSADKSDGEAQYSGSTKAEVMAKIMHDLQARSPAEVNNIFKALYVKDDNGRPADQFDKPEGNETYEKVTGQRPDVTPADNRKSFGNSGETYDATTHSASAVKPIIAREHIEEIFTGQELSEELLNRAAVVYEAAVNSRIAIIEARLEEQYTSALEEAIDLVHEEVVDSVDKYISYVAKQWIDANQLSVDNGLKAEMAEQLLHSLKETFEANYISVSDEKADILNDMATEIETLKARLSEEFESKVSLEEQLEKYKVSDVVTEMSDGMTVAEKQKFLTLVENISYSDFNDFNRKAEVLKETYFAETPVKNSSAEPLTEDYVYDDEEKAVNVPSNMKVYAETISRIVKK